MIRWGIIGAGRIAHRFVKALMNETDSRLYAISCRTQQKADAFAQQYGNVKAYAGFDCIVNDPDVDAVYVSVPHAYHKDWIIRCLKAGKPVLCEKPLCLNEEEVDEVLAAYRIEKRENGTIIPPLDRVDLKEQCDIDEEVFRYFPATRITPSLKDFPITQGHLSDEQKKKREIRELLVSRGLDEILSFTLISEKEDASIRVFNNNEGFKIINPMTKDHEIVRSDLLPSLIATVDYNKAHQNKNLALFEISPIDTPKGNHLYLSIALCGEKMGRDEYMSRPYDFFDLKGYVYAVLRKIGLTDSRFRIAYSKNEKFHPNCSADIFVGKDLVGTFGQLHPLFYEDKLFVAELDLGKLLSLKGMNTKFASFSSFPEVRRDLSFRMNDKVDYALLKKTILHIKDTNVRDVCLFDEFTDKLTGITYLGVSVFLGKEDGTLKDNEITSSIKKITDACKSELGLTLKGE